MQLQLSMSTLSLLPACDLRRSAAVSRVWRTLTEDHRLWRELCQETSHLPNVLADMPHPAIPHIHCSLMGQKGQQPGKGAQ